MGAKLTVNGLDVGSNTSLTVGAITNLQFATAAIPFVNSNGYASVDIPVYQILGVQHVGYIQPLTNGAYPRFTPVDGSGNVIPFSATMFYSYNTSYGDTGVTNQTSAWTAGIPWYNTGSSPSGLCIIEGSGAGGFATSYAISPHISIRTIYQYNTYTVYRQDSITLGSSQSINADFNAIRISFNSGNLFAAFGKPIYAS